MLYLFIYLCLFLLHFLKTMSAVCSSASASRDQVTSAVVNFGVHPSVLLVTSVCPSFRRSTVAPGLTMSAAGRLSAPLLAWILCAVAGSAEAQSPAPESRKSPCYLLHKNSPTSLCPLRLRSGGGHMTRKADRSPHLSFQLFRGQLKLVCVLWEKGAKSYPHPLELLLVYNSGQKMNKPLSCCTVLLSCFVSDTL